MSVPRLPLGSSSLSIPSASNRAASGYRYRPYPSTSTAMSVNNLVLSGSHGHGVSPPESPLAGGVQLPLAMNSQGSGEMGFAGSRPTGSPLDPVGGSRASGGSPGVPGWTPTASLQDREVSEARLSAYTMPAQTGTFSSTPEDMFSAPSLGLQDLELMCHELGIEAERQQVYNFHELSMDSKLTILFMHSRVVDAKVERTTAAYLGIQLKLESIYKLVQQAWQPSKAQLILVRSLVRHFVVKPIASYNHIADYVKSYVRDHAAKLRLGLYVEDQTVKVTLNAVIGELTIQAKSAVRKAVFASIKKRIPLSTFCRSMLDNYHLPAIPAEIPLAVLGTFALLRDIAAPLTNRRKTTGDTGFWREVEERLAALYKKNSGTDRDNDSDWTAWARKLIDQDQESYPSAGITSLPTTREEMNRVLGLTADGEENREIDIDSPDNSPAPEDGVDRGRLPDDDMDGDVALADLGDVAATMQMSV